MLTGRINYVICGRVIVRRTLFAHANNLTSEMIPNVFENLIHDEALKSQLTKKEERLKKIHRDEDEWGGRGWAR